MTVMDFIIFAVCLFGCAAQSYYLGRNRGIEATLDHLVSEGILEYDDDE